MLRNTELPDSLKKVHHSLEPYIKTRQEVVRIRQILAAHLSTHVHQKEAGPIFHPLSLIEASPDPESTLKGIKGLQREYFQCLVTNVRAKREFAEASKAHQLRSTTQVSAHGDGGQDISQVQGCSEPLPTFIDVVKFQRKHERLHIMRDYVDSIAERLPTTVEQFGSGNALEGVGYLPKVPPEVMGTADARPISTEADLKNLVNHLEKAVLRAKLMFAREQKFIARIKSQNNIPSSKRLDFGQSTKLKALGTTRNELINWIETELASTSDDGEDPESRIQVKAPENSRDGFIEHEFVSVQRQYHQYAKLRRSLIIAATGYIDQPPHTKIAPGKDVAESDDLAYSSDSTNHIMYPYLSNMISISSEQKSVIQQKSHFTICLAKHLKEASQGVDRLSEESHLLSTHPVPRLTSRGNDFDSLSSFSASISNNEKPDSSDKARAWIFAAGRARAATNSSVLEKVEEGQNNLLDSRGTLLELQHLFEQDSKVSKGTDQKGHYAKRVSTLDAWGLLDGNLGAIK